MLGVISPRIALLRWCQPILFIRARSLLSQSGLTHILRLKKGNKLLYLIYFNAFETCTALVCQDSNAYLSMYSIYTKRTPGGRVHTALVSPPLARSIRRL